MIEGTELVKKYTRYLFSIDGVSSLWYDQKNNVLVVGVINKQVCAKLPTRLEGVRVRCKVVGRLRAL